MTGEAQVIEAPVVRQGSPWRRWVAHMFDIYLAGFPVMMVAMVAWALIAPDSALTFFDRMETGGMGVGLVAGMALLALSVPMLVILLAFTGTPGKWLCGIKVVRIADGKRPTLREACLRELLVWSRGLGLGVPLVSLGTQLLAYSDLESEGTSAWDRKLGLRVEMAPLGFGGYLKFAIAILSVVALRVFDIISMAG